MNSMILLFFHIYIIEYAKLGWIVDTNLAE